MVAMRRGAKRLLAVLAPVELGSLQRPGHLDSLLPAGFAQGWLCLRTALFYRKGLGS